MSVRVKFKVDNIGRQHASVHNPVTGKYEPGETQTVNLSPVYGNGDPAHENTKFYAATPCGSINLSTINKAAGVYFELGQEYYIDFTKATTAGA